MIVAQATGIKNQFFALIKAHEQKFSMVYLTIKIDYKNCPRHVFCGQKRIGCQSASCNLSKWRDIQEERCAHGLLYVAKIN